jgi:hypothetical protein
MPLNIVIGLVALLVALVCYSVGVWGAFRRKLIGTRDLTLLWIGFVFDVLATTMMGMQIGGLDFSASGWLHTVIALIGMFGMLAAAIVGTYAMVRKNDAARAAVTRWALAPWAVWVFVFVWGMVTRGSARMGG